jgi:hypothetical protein
MTGDDETKMVWEFLHKVNRLTAWENGLYKANCGCVHRFTTEMNCRWRA